LGLGGGGGKFFAKILVFVVVFRLFFLGLGFDVKGKFFAKILVKVRLFFWG